MFGTGCMQLHGAINRESRRAVARELPVRFILPVEKQQSPVLYSTPDPCRLVSRARRLRFGSSTGPNPAQLEFRVLAEFAIRFGAHRATSLHSSCLVNRPRAHSFFGRRRWFPVRSLLVWHMLSSTVCCHGTSHISRVGNSPSSRDPECMDGNALEEQRAVGNFELSVVWGERRCRYKASDVRLRRSTAFNRGICILLPGPPCRLREMLAQVPFRPIQVRAMESAL